MGINHTVLAQRLNHLRVLGLALQQEAKVVAIHCYLAHLGTANADGLAAGLHTHTHTHTMAQKQSKASDDPIHIFLYCSCLFMSFHAVVAAVVGAAQAIVYCRGWMWFVEILAVAGGQSL